MMRYIRLFGRWYVHPADRGGLQVDESGVWRLCFEGVASGCTLCVNGSGQPIKDGEVRVRTALPAMKLKLVYPDGKHETVEPLSFNNGRFAPGHLKADEFLLLLASRLQALEGRVDQEESDIKTINDKRQGALYLGGAKK